jgi:hypothetical protein
LCKLKRYDYGIERFQTNNYELLVGAVLPKRKKSLKKNTVFLFALLADER